MHKLSATHKRSSQRSSPSSDAMRKKWDYQTNEVGKGSQIGKKGVSSSLNTKVIDDKPMLDKEITPQTIAIGRFYL
jgi:hypothetical protein